MVPTFLLNIAPAAILHVVVNFFVHQLCEGGGGVEGILLFSFQCSVRQVAGHAECCYKLLIQVGGINHGMQQD